MLCEVVGKEFDAQWALIDGYQLDWDVTPSLEGAVKEGQFFIIESKSWVVGKQYIIVCWIALKEFPDTSKQLTYYFTPEAMPDDY